MSISQVNELLENLVLELFSIPQTKENRDIIAADTVNDMIELAMTHCYDILDGRKKKFETEEANKRHLAYKKKD